MIGSGRGGGGGPGAPAPWRRGYAAASAAVGLATVLALARAGGLVGETGGRACGDLWDALRRSFMVHSCHLSDVDRFDALNGGIVVLAMLAALNPTLLALRIPLLVMALLYLGDAGRMRAEFAATGRVHPGIELWWLPISWLSAFILLVAVAVAAYRRVKRWRRSTATARPGVTAASRRPPTAPGTPPPAGRRPP